MAVDTGTREVLRMPVEVDLDEALAHLNRETRRFADLVGSLRDAEISVPPLAWNAAETAVHVLQALRYYTDCIEGRVETPPEPVADALEFGARLNERQIEAEPERDPKKLAALLVDALEGYERAARTAGGEAPVTFSNGYTREVVAATCGHIADIAVHAYDIARAAGRNWRIDPEAAKLGVYSTTDVLHLALNEDAARGVSIHGRIHVRRGQSVDVRVADGRVRAEKVMGSPDFHFSVDPVSYLMVAFGRRNVVRELLRGRSIAWGRKPWAGLTLAKIFYNP